MDKPELPSTTLHSELSASFGQQAAGFRLTAGIPRWAKVSPPQHGKCKFVVTADLVRAYQLANCHFRKNS